MRLEDRGASLILGGNRQIGPGDLLGSPPGPGDLDSLARLFSDERVVATLGGARSREAVGESLSRWEKLWAERGFGPWIFRVGPNRAFMGYVGVAMASAGEPGEVELLYGLMPEFWGAGRATRASRLAVDFVFDPERHPEPLDELIAYALVDNLASRRVIEKVGFDYEREIEHAGLPHAFYRLKRAKWNESASESEREIR